MTAEEVIRLIEGAWREVPYPGDDKIVPADSLEFDDIENYFRGTTWRGHSPIDLRCRSAAFTFFTPQAFHYWLPAFMIAAIKNSDEADVVVDYIPRSVSNGGAPQRWPLFSQVQREAVAAYLRFRIEKFSDGVDDERIALRILEEAANKTVERTGAPPLSSDPHRES
jgi:hypothetical protein